MRPITRERSGYSDSGHVTSIDQSGPRGHRGHHYPGGEGDHGPAQQPQPVPVISREAKEDPGHGEHADEGWTRQYLAHKYHNMWSLARILTLIDDI